MLSGRLAAIRKKERKNDSRLRGNDDFRILGLRAILLAVLSFVSLSAFTQVANDTPPQFRDAAEEARFHRLTSELRCVMCQNQSLADSNAQIARDLRREVLEQMHAGRTDAQIEQFLVDRYGEFVLYQPRVEGRTWLLWFGPPLLLAAGAALVALAVRRRGKAGIPVDEEQEW